LRARGQVVVASNLSGIGFRSSSPAHGSTFFTVSAVVALFGGGLVALGSLLDWSGVSYSSRLDRSLALAAGLLVILVAALCLTWHRRLLLAAVPPAVLAANMGVVNYDDIANRRYEFEAYPAADVGIGLYLVIIGAGLGVLAGLAAIAPYRRLRSRVLRDDGSVECPSQPSRGEQR
jgi:hypothetical protein